MNSGRNSKADQLEEGLSLYGSHEYADFISSLGHRLGSAPSGHVCLRLDIRDFYPSIRHSLLIDALSTSAACRACEPKVEMQVQIEATTGIGMPGSGITVDLVGLHPSALSGYVLLELDKKLEELERGLQVIIVRYLDDLNIIGQPTDVLEAEVEIANCLARLGLDLNKEKTHLQTLEEARLDYGIDVAPRILDSTPEEGAVLLLNTSSAGFSRLDSVQKLWIFRCARGGASEPNTTTLLTLLLSNPEFIESCSYGQAIACLRAADRVLGSLTIVSRAFDNLAEEWTCATITWLRALKDLCLPVVGKLDLIDALSTRAKASNCLEVAEIEPEVPKLIA